MWRNHQTAQKEVCNVIACKMMNSETLRTLRLYLACTKFTDHWPKNRCERMWLIKMLNCFLKAFLFKAWQKEVFEVSLKLHLFLEDVHGLQVSPFQTQRLLFPWKNCRETDEMNKLITLGSITILVSNIDKLLLSLPLLLNFSPSAQRVVGEKFPEAGRRRAI